MASSRIHAIAFVVALTSVLGQKPLCRDVHDSGPGSWRDCRVQIGGLAIRGAADFRAKLGPTFGGYLTDVYNVSDGLEFEAVALNFDQNFEFVSGRKVDFIYSNPGAYTCLMVEFGVSTVASLLNFRKGHALEKFAGVIFSRAGSDFTTVESLRRARVEAVSISGLGAMQLQQAELLRAGLNVMSDVPRLTFAYNQNKIVQDVQSGYADVGFVRTDMIDRLEAANSTKTNWSQFQVIRSFNDTAFPFLRSTGFTPEWPIGALTHVPYEVSQKVGQALMGLDRESPDPHLSAPAIAGNFATWVPPLNYFELLSMLEEIGYYNADTRSCLRSADVHAAIQCPAGYIKKSAELAFCDEASTGQACKANYTCVCEPCAKLKDPAFLLSATAVSTSWTSGVDVSALEASTSLAPQCARMDECATVAVGQLVRWSLLDQIGHKNRLQISAPLVESVEILWRIDAEWTTMEAENVTLHDGLITQRYSFTAPVEKIGTHIVQLRINGQQAPMSPTVAVHFDPPQRELTCPSGHKAEDDGSCVACPPGTHSAVAGRPSRPVCRPCGLGRFNNMTGMAACHPCPMGFMVAVCAYAE